MNKLKLAVAGLAALVVVGGATAAGFAYADPTPPAPTPGSSPSPGTGPKDKDQKKGEHGWRGRALHGEATVGGREQTRVIVFQRGVVTKISPTEIELRSEDGYVARYRIAGDVRVRKADMDDDKARGNKTQGTLADVRAGQRVRLLATKDGEILTAKRIIVVG